MAQPLAWPLRLRLPLPPLLQLRLLLPPHYFRRQQARMGLVPAPGLSVHDSAL
jgi:hypothetical protein